MPEYEYTLDKNVPLSRKVMVRAIDDDWTAKGETKYPWHVMQVGESVFMQSATENIKKVEAQRMQSARGHAYRWDKKFAIRTRHENGKRGIRVWRIK